MYRRDDSSVKIHVSIFLTELFSILTMTEFQCQNKNHVCSLQSTVGSLYFCLVIGRKDWKLGNLTLKCVIFLSSSLNFWCFLVCCTLRLSEEAAQKWEAIVGSLEEGCMSSKDFQSQHSPYIQKSFTWPSCL